MTLLVWHRGVDEGAFGGLETAATTSWVVVLQAKAGEAEADEGVVAGDAVVGVRDEGPGEAAVGGAQDAAAVEGVGGVVGIAGAGEDDAGLDADGTDAERRDGGGAGVGAEDGESVGEWREGDAAAGPAALVDFQTPPPVVPT